MTFRFLFSVFFLIIFKVALFAIEAPITLRMAYDIGLSSRWDIKAAQAAVRRAQFDMAVLDGRALPSVNLVFNETFQDASAVGTGVSSVLTNPQRSDYKISAKQYLFTGFRQEDAIASAKARVEMEKSRLMSLSLEIKQQIATRYFEVLHQQVTLKNLLSTKQVFQKRLDEVERRVRLGKSRSGDLALLRSQLATIDRRLVLAQGDKLVAEASLSQALGVTKKLIISDQNFDPLTRVDIDQDMVMRIVSQWPEVRLGEAELRAKKSDLALAGRTWLPTVSLGGNYYFKRAESLSAINWDVLVSAEFPLFSGGSEYAKIDSEKESVKQLQHNLEKVRQNLVLQLQSRVDHYISARASLKYAQLAYTEAVNAQVSYEQEYRSGLSTLMDVLQVMNEVLLTQESLAVAKLNAGLHYEIISLYVEERP
jgi:outer membrane protein